MAKEKKSQTRPIYDLILLNITIILLPAAMRDQSFIPWRVVRPKYHRAPGTLYCYE